MFRLGQRNSLTRQPAKTVGMAIREVNRDDDPLPAFGTEAFGFSFQLLCDQAVEQRRVLQPAAVIIFEQVAQDATAGSLIGFAADEQRTPIRGLHRALGELPADVEGLPVVAVGKRVPHLLLAHVVVCDREGHELLQRHPIIGVDVEQLGRDRRETQALLHHSRRDEKARRNIVLTQPLITEHLEGAELIEGMEIGAVRVLGERVFLGRGIRARLPHNAGDECCLGETLLLHQEFERPITAAAGGYFIPAGLPAIGIENRTDVEALQQRPPRDVVGKRLDRHAGLHAPDIRLGQDKLVEWDIARGR